MANARAAQIAAHLNCKESDGHNLSCTYVATT